MHHTLIRAKKENFSLHSYSWAYSFCAVLGPCKQKKYSTLKKGYEGSNRLFKKIHHFRDPTLGTLGEWLVGKLRILKVLESPYVGEAQTRFHPLPLPQSRARDRLFWGYFR